jgi:hypothetical protein
MGDEGSDDFALSGMGGMECFLVYCFSRCVFGTACMYDLRCVLYCAYNGYFATVYAFSAEVLTVLGTRCLMVIRITMLKQQ